MSSVGVCIFTYDRPDHLRRVLSGLEANSVEHLYIFSDGPKTSADRPQVTEVRDTIDDIDWCEPTVVCREDNLGLAQSVITGVNRVFEDHDRIVVLEDDCVPSPDFISYMRTCLYRYEQNDRVMNVTGYCPPITIPSEYPYGVYFTYRSSSWGWGTWQRAWDQFEQDPMSLREFERRSDEIKRTVAKAGRDLYPMMRKQLKGEIDSWAVWWSYAIARRNGVCVNPVRSKIRNIGHDGTGTHTGDSERYDVSIHKHDGPFRLPADVYVDSSVNTSYNRFISGGRRRVVKERLAAIIKRLGLWGTYRAVRRAL